MQKELAANFPFYEPQSNQSSPQSQQPFYQQPGYNPPPNKNSSQSPVHVLDGFQKPIFGEDEINTLNKNSFILTNFKPKK